MIHRKLSVIMKTCPYNNQRVWLSVNFSRFFLIFLLKILIVGTCLFFPGHPNEYPQSMFWIKIQDNVDVYHCILQVHRIKVGYTFHGHFFLDVKQPIVVQQCYVLYMLYSMQ